ncbi:uncharacterized protein LOC144236384 [Crocuta crocuta]
MEPGTGTSTSAVAGGSHSWSACTSGGTRTSGSGPASPDPACALPGAPGTPAGDWPASAPGSLTSPVRGAGRPPASRRRQCVGPVPDVGEPPAWRGEQIGSAPCAREKKVHAAEQSRKGYEGRSSRRSLTNEVMCPDNEYSRSWKDKRWIFYCSLLNKGETRDVNRG